MYRPAEAAQMTTPLILQVPTMTDYKGVRKNTFANAGTFLANFKTYGGTEHQVDGILQVEETASITTWFRPDITSGCRIQRVTDGAVFEILGEPENIEQRNMILKFKVRRIKGGV